jgi:hypothetical protein
MNSIKSKLFLLAIALLWLRLILAEVETIPCTIALLWKKDKEYKRYVWGIWIGQDQLVNRTLGGNPDVTVSSKVGYLSNKFGKHSNTPSMTARAMEKFIDFGFKKLAGQDNHCDESFEADEEHYSYFWR